jgi:hypothetical protein
MKEGGGAAAMMSQRTGRAAACAPTGWILLTALVGGLVHGTERLAAQEPRDGAADATARPTDGSELPTPDELRALVAPAESVAVSPHGVRLESFRGDTISGVFLVDSDLPTSRHVAFGKDPRGYRYVWFSRKNPLRVSVVAIYEVNGKGFPDVLYWRQVDFEAKVGRAREFRAPAAAGVTFQFSSGPPCGEAKCEEGWQDLPLERVDVAAKFFEPLAKLFKGAAEHGEPHIDRPVASLKGVTRP